MTRKEIKEMAKAVLKETFPEIPEKEIPNMLKEIVEEYEREEEQEKASQ